MVSKVADVCVSSNVFLRFSRNLVHMIYVLMCKKSVEHIFKFFKIFGKFSEVLSQQQSI